MYGEPQRLGRFEISHVLIFENPELAKLIMGDMIIIRAKAEIGDLSIKYMATSDLFDGVAEGSIVPEYDIIVDTYTKNVIAKRK